jgi:outer membrane PBP1 activator LpoA protein
MRELLLATLLISTSSAAATGSCEALYAQHLETDLALSYEAFDQSEGKGFRILAANGCEKQAADLIVRYIESTRATQSSLRWHVAQLRATAGETAEAIRYARSVLGEKEDWVKNPLRWNDYVLATIAFLEHDRESLQAHRDRIAQGKTEHFGNELNLRLVDSLVKHFDKDYRYATSHIDKQADPASPSSSSR